MNTEEKRRKEEVPFPFTELVLLLAFVGVAYVGYLKKYPSEAEKLKEKVTTIIPWITSCDDAKTCDESIGGPKKK